MKYRIFGRNSGLRVSEIGLGSGLFGAETHPRGSKADCQAVFDVYVNAGGRFIDTAEGYQSGRSEEYIGDFVCKTRNDFVIASKFSVGRTRSENYPSKGNSRKAMMTAVEGSLRRLKTDHIDLYWLHAHDAMTPVEETLRGFDDLIRSGKILYGGLSNFPAWRVAFGAQLASAMNFAPITAISYEYGLAERSAEREIIPMAEALGIGVGFWSPLGGGFLARENSDDGSPPQSHLAHWRGLGRPTPKDTNTRDVLRGVANRLDVSPARLATAWLLHRSRKSPTGLVPIAGASSADQVKDILGAIDMDLPVDALKQLEDVSRLELGEPYNHNKFHQDLTHGGEHYPPPFTVA